ncbi:Chromosomal replication initiator protein DnaA [Caulifigura coniformis]|uniref:Chromosomal replication initiator protein DnaA n=1 Tax=Caulifigura coniformis TaxID=2527983 RepID=A0A517SDV2_9PLAN|nr:chromosomal replication initiator protein DnaA [Caulifigura coniformis]QDT54303.1 Chromosomal replication initiator protein DnaA [Caulifigura coniformis]
MGVEHDVPKAGYVGRILQLVQSALTKRRNRNWFDGKSARIDWRNEALVVYAQSPILLGWLQKNYHDLLWESARMVGGPDAVVRYEVDAALKPEVPVLAAPAAQTLPVRGATRALAPASTPPSRSRQNKPFELQRFVRGPSNELAATAVQTLIEFPDSCPNPMYIHGGVGCGKTHLLEGLREGLGRRQPGLQLLAITSEEFTNLFTQALDTRSLPSFRQKFRNVDVLLVDDVDFFDGKRVVQEEFLHTIKHMLNHGRRVVVTADRHPRLLSRTSDELLSLYQSGLVCRLEAPDATTRLNIVKQLADRMKLNATVDALEYVAERFTRNVRELEGAVHYLTTWQNVNGTRVTVSAARDALSVLVRDCMKIVRLADVENAVCNLFGLPADELRSARRQRTVSEPRMLAMFLARRLTQAAYTEIGAHFGGRNHSTVMSAERKISGLMKSKASVRIAAQDWPVSELIAQLEQQLKAV